MNVKFSFPGINAQECHCQLLAFEKLSNGSAEFPVLPDTPTGNACASLLLDPSQHWVLADFYFYSVLHCHFLTPHYIS